MTHRWKSAAVLILLTPLLISAAPPVHASNPANQSPREQLQGQMAALGKISSLHAKFVSEKRLAMLTDPLRTQGEVWIAQPDHVRFSTLKPYQSELILSDRQVRAKSQHEDHWTVTEQSSRPGLTAVMGQLGSWALGDFAGALDMYTVETGAGPVPPRPAVGDLNTPAAPSAPESEAHPSELAIFELVPKNETLAKAVKSITLAINSQTHHLVYFELLTSQGDATRYWFYQVTINQPLPPDVFKPVARP